MGEGPSHACAARYSISAEWSLFDVLLMRICVDASWASVALNVSASACQGICTGLNISRRAGQRGAKRIFAGVSHAVLGEQGRQRIADSDIEELISTNSTPYAVGPKVKTVSVAEILAEAIRRIHLGESVTSLFDIS